MTVQTVQGHSENHATLAYSTPALAPRIYAGDVLALGFGITVAVWLIAYLSRMPLVNAPPPVTVLSMIAAIFLGGIVAGRFSPKGAVGALLAGALSGVLDILILGSLIADSSNGHINALNLLATIAGSIAFNALVAGIGGVLGSRFPSPTRATIRWTQVFPIVLATATLPLISAGGLVTAFRAGLAVPDWPNSFGWNMFLFPLSHMQANDGKFYEHAHRLMGSLVGLTSLTVAIYITVARTSAQMKTLAWSLFLAVCIQGALGGTRVTEQSLALAIIHGIFAQIVFAAMAVLATSAAPPLVTESPSLSTDRTFAAALVGALFIQLILGALVRHTHTLVMVHITMATIVTILALVAGFRAWGLHVQLPEVRKTGLVILLLVLMQLALGIIALIFRPAPGEDPTPRSAILTTLHQANGAVLLAMAAVLLTLLARATKPDQSPQR